MAVVEVEIDGRVATVTLNRPEVKNAINPEMVVRLARVWDDVAADREVRAVVLTGAAGTTFCSGADLGSLAPLVTGSRDPVDEWDHELVDDWSLLNRMLVGVDLGKPLVVAANGHAIAGGMLLLMAGDVRVMASGCRLGLTEVKLGLLAAGGGTALLARQMPAAMAREVLLTGDLMVSDRAYDVGFVNHVVPGDQVLAKAQEIAQSIASNGPLAVRAAMEVMAAAADMTEADARAFEHERELQVHASEDAKEGPLAYMEKRAPRFEGR